MKKTAVITGASSGIGFEFAKQLSKQGYSLILIARRTDRLKQLSKHLETDCGIIGADLTDLQACESVCQKIGEREIELFINNAGYGDCGEFSDTDLEKELSMVQLNIQAVHYFTKKMLQKMKRQRHGSILNVASSAGLFSAGPYMATYYATKSYVCSLTRAIAMELKEEHSPVYVGCLCPGPVNTEFNNVANVEFALKGISPAYCVKYALKHMKKRQVVIIPTFYMKLAVMLGSHSPQAITVRLVSRQQRKKIYPSVPKKKKF